MTKSLKWTLISVLTLLVLVVLAGMYKFNYLSNQDGYDVDGNTIKNTSSQVSNMDNIIGEWFTPKAATLKIQFRSDGTYTFYDSDSLGNDKTYNGTFTLNDTLVVISKENNVTEKFSFKQGDKGDSNFYLKNEVHYMVKSETYSEISWEEMQKKILEAQYKSMAQTHYKGFTLITNNEMTYFTFQPEIDAYQKVLEKCKTCPKVPVASE